MGGFWVETRADGLPWTKEGCNDWRNGKFVPYPTEPAAQAAIDTRKTDRTKFDDPMWARAEYRVVPVRRRK